MPMKLTIPEFVPSDGSIELEWSPTSGSRPRRPLGDAGGSDGGQLAYLETSVQDCSNSPPPPPPPLPTQIGSLEPVPSPYNPSPPGPVTVPPDRRYTNTDAAPLADITNHGVSLHISGNNNNDKNNNNPRQVEDHAAHQHPVTPIKRDKHPNTVGPMTTAAYDTIGGDPTSLTGEKASTETYLTAPASDSPNNPRHGAYPSRGQHRPRRKESSPFSNQLDPTTFHPDPQIWGSSAPAPVHQPRMLVQPLTTTLQQTSTSQVEPALTIPLPGSMDPLAYWNLLYHRESHIISRLAAAGLPLTQQQMQYIALLQDARVGAAASQLPLRGKRGSKAWLRELEQVYCGIWVLKPGQTGWSEEVMARKKDFERAVVGEIEMAKMEGRMR
ncbi:MAG: hypothetical protein Q9163_001617 [Psora crenata]